MDPPKLDKNKSNILRYVGNETWQLSVGDEVTHTYDTEDLRMSIVYRAKCFKSEAERDRFNSMSEEEKMTLESILDKLKMDLARKSIK